MMRYSDIMLLMAESSSENGIWFGQIDLGGKTW